MAKKLYEKYDLETLAYLYEAEFFEEGQQPLGYTSVMKGSFINAFLDIKNGVAYEGATLEEISIKKTPLYVERIAKNVSGLTIRALASSMGKEGSREYLESIKLIHNEKYNVIKNNKNNSTMVRAITDEFNRNYPTDVELNALLVSNGLTPTGNRFKKISDFIIYKHETESNLYDLFISLIEDFRTCASRHIAKFEFDKAELVNIMVENLPPQITLEILEQKRTEMLSIKLNNKIKKNEKK